MTIALPDLTSIDAWTGGGILPPGKHTCRITEARESLSSGGHTQLEMVWAATGGENAGLEIREWLVVIDRTLGKVKAFLDAVGYQIPQGSFSLDVSQLVGKTATILVQEEPDRMDSTKVRSRVKAHEPAHPETGGDWTQTIGSGTKPAEEKLPF